MSDGSIGSFGFFKTMILVNLFFAVSITIFAHGLEAMSSSSLAHITTYQALGDRLGLEDVGEEVESGLERELNVPLLDIGALVFYSGNILIDLLLNFAFAIPQMLLLLTHSFGTLFNIDTTGFFLGQIQLFAGVIFGIFYIFGFVQLLLGIRSGRTIT